MKVLLDTCTFLWILTDPSKLSKAATDLFTAPENEVFTSSVSSWEIAVKNALGRLPLPKPPSTFIPAQREAHGIRPLSLDEESTLYLPRLPTPHKDPFDRMLVCQAIVHGLAILSPDEVIHQYPVRVIW